MIRDAILDGIEIAKNAFIIPNLRPIDSKK